MMQYYRVRNIDEMERALKINLVNHGFVDETVQFIPAAERWQINSQLVQMGMQDLSRLIGSSAASYSSRTDQGQEGDAAKTATEVMAIVQSTNQMVSATVAQVYEYKRFEYMETARRFARKNSEDGDVRKFRVDCLKAGIPEEVMDFECWDVMPERVIGAGNKMMEMAIMEKLMGARQMLDPEPQRAVLRDFVLALTDDPARAEQLVPEDPVKVTNSVHDAQITMASLMIGAKVDPMTGQNHIEIIETLLGELGLLVDRTMQANNPTPEKLMGFGNVAAYIGAHIQILASDKNEGERVKEYGDALGKIGNEVKAMTQQMEQQQQAQQPQNGEVEKEKIKLQSMEMQAQAKQQNLRESHAQRTATKQTQWEMSMQREQQEHAMKMEQMRQEHDLEMKKELHKTQVEDDATTITTAGELKRQQMKSMSEEE
jgi:hypothetical protein